MTEAPAPPDHRTFDIPDGTFEIYRSLTSIRPGEGNGPLFLALMALVGGALWMLGSWILALHPAIALFICLVLCFPLSFVAFAFLTRAARFWFLTFHPRKEALGAFDREYRRHLLEMLEQRRRDRRARKNR